MKEEVGSLLLLLDPPLLQRAAIIILMVPLKGCMSLLSALNDSSALARLQSRSPLIDGAAIRIITNPAASAPAIAQFVFPRSLVSVSTLSNANMGKCCAADCVNTSDSLGGRRSRDSVS